MESINRMFFDEYTKLDNLCRQMFASDNSGVTAYIEAMASTPYAKRCNIPDWDSDLKMLKQYRHIRNHFAHTTGAFHEELCVQYDVTWIKNFTSRILTQKDPLALLFKMSRSKNNKNNTSKHHSHKKSKKKKTVIPLRLILLMLFVLFVVILIIIAK